MHKSQFNHCKVALMAFAILVFGITSNTHAQSGNKKVGFTEVYNHFMTRHYLSTDTWDTIRIEKRGGDWYVTEHFKSNPRTRRYSEMIYSGSKGTFLEIKSFPRLAKIKKDLGEQRINSAFAKSELDRYKYFTYYGYPGWAVDQDKLGGSSQAEMIAKVKVRYELWMDALGANEALTCQAKSALDLANAADSAAYAKNPFAKAHKAWNNYISSLQALLKAYPNALDLPAQDELATAYFTAALMYKALGDEANSKECLNKSTFSPIATMLASARLASLDKGSIYVGTMSNDLTMVYVQWQNKTRADATIIIHELLESPLFIMALKNGIWPGAPVVGLDFGDYEIVMALPVRIIAGSDWRMSNHLSDHSGPKQRQGNNYYDDGEESEPEYSEYADKAVIEYRNRLLYVEPRDGYSYWYDYGYEEGSMFAAKMADIEEFMAAPALFKWLNVDYLQLEYDRNNAKRYWPSRLQPEEEDYYSGRTAIKGIYLSKGYMSRAQMLVFKIMSHTNWSRPIVVGYDLTGEHPKTPTRPQESQYNLNGIVHALGYTLYPYDPYRLVPESDYKYKNPKNNTVQLLPSSPAYDSLSINKMYGDLLPMVRATINKAGNAEEKKKYGQTLAQWDAQLEYRLCKMSCWTVLATYFPKGLEVWLSSTIRYSRRGYLEPSGEPAMDSSAVESAVDIEEMGTMDMSR